MDEPPLSRDLLEDYHEPFRYSSCRISLIIMTLSTPDRRAKTLGRAENPAERCHDSLPIKNTFYIPLVSGKQVVLQLVWTVAIKR